LILFFTAIGFLVGAVAVYFSTRGGSSAVKKELEQLRLRDKQLRDLVGFSRERASNKLIVWLGGKILSSPKQLTDMQRQQLAADVKEFLTWLGVEPAQAAPTPAAPVPPEAPAQALFTPSADAAAAAIPPSSVAPQPHTGQTGPLQPRTGQTGPLQPRTGQTGPLPPQGVTEEKKVEKPLSIVEQINGILQDMIRGTPLENKGLRLVEDPRKGVVVWVGLEHFAGVDAVVDPEIKEALRAAAAEWERRMERNRR
jgi:hypothetical protein